MEDECYRMHVVVNSKEYSKEYRKSDVLKELKSGQHRFELNNPGFDPREKERQKLLPQDRISNTERIILCHVIRITSEPNKRLVEPENLLRTARPKPFRQSAVQIRKKRRTRANQFCESDPEESSAKVSSDEEGQACFSPVKNDITDVKPIALSRPKRACIMKSVNVSAFKDESSLLKKGPGRPPKKQSNNCSNLNPETEVIEEEPETKEKNESLQKVELKSNESMETLTENMDNFDEINKN